MVLDSLFPSDWLEKKFQYAFILGFCYSIIGIVIAKLLFPSNSGIVSVIFTSILLIPYMRKIMGAEETSEEKRKKFTLKSLYQLHYDVILMYFLIFFGIFFSYLIASFLLPQFGINTFNLLKEQLFLDPSLRGHAAFSYNTFQSIFYNNWWVLLATFILALMAGDGAIFFVTWNASAWATIFGSRALHAALYSGQSSLPVLLQLIAIVIWHVILEGGAYMLAGISGSIISNEIIKERIEVKEFLVWLAVSSGLFFLFAYMAGFFISNVLIKFILYFALTIVLFHFLGIAWII
jgi:hypothetical protein